MSLGPQPQNRIKMTHIKTVKNLNTCFPDINPRMLHGNNTGRGCVCKKGGRQSDIGKEGRGSGQGGAEWGSREHTRASEHDR